jgi:hypothetical protein
MTTPEDPYPWLPLDDVVAWVAGSAPGVNPNETQIEWARLAAAGYCEDNRRDLVDEAGDFVPTPRVVMAGKLLAANVYARKGSPSGLATFAEFATAVLSYDPHVERLLGIGRYAAPEVG